MILFKTGSFRPLILIMKIGIDASFLRKPHTGIGQVTTNFLQKLADFVVANYQTADHEMEFFLYLEEDVELALPSNFHKRVFLPLWKRDDIVRAIWWQKYLLPQRACKDGCEVFLSLFQCATVMPKKIGHIMVIHDVLLEFFPHYLDNWRKKYFWRISKKAIRNVDRIVAVSHRTEKDLIQFLHVPAEKISVAYVDVDEIYKKEVPQSKSDEVLKRYGLKKGYIYHGGGLEMRKNTENLLRAYKLLLDNSEDIEGIPPLVISGKMQPKLKPLVTDVKELVATLGLEENVKLLDFVPQSDLPAIYKNALMFVYPSQYEGFGLPVLEAMNQGIPVVTSKKSSLPEIGLDSVLYCNPDEIEDIELVMYNVLKNKKLQSTLSFRGRERAKYFSMDRFTEKVLHKMENLSFEKK